MGSELSETSVATTTTMPTTAPSKMATVTKPDTVQQSASTKAPSTPSSSRKAPGPTTAGSPSAPGPVTKRGSSSGEVPSSVPSQLVLGAGHGGERRSYLLGETIGVGAYAKVKLARSVATGKRVAVKIISKRRAPDGYIAKFLPRELAAMSKIRHPNVVRTACTRGCVAPNAAQQTLYRAYVGSSRYTIFTRRSFLKPVATHRSVQVLS